jgi:acyl-CoA reductase-like NAD-dependent aldehyde dehydrogenase
MQVMDAVEAAPNYDAPMLIGGEHVTTGRRVEVRNPAYPDEVVGTTASCEPADVERAIAAAKSAQQQWAARMAVERAAVLGVALNMAEREVDERAVLYVRENGKTLAEARREIASVSTRGRITLSLAEELDRGRELEAQRGRTHVRYLPYGVVSAIVPWNAPVPLASMQIIPALLTGNAVVLKVPETCPLALTRTVELLAEALPPGLLNLVSGRASEIGPTLLGHPDVDRIAFVGSIPSARRIIADAGQGIRGVVAELGGNDAAIVLDDADLSDATMDRMAGVVFRMAGQVCMAIKRIYVPASLKEAFIEAFAKSMDRIVVGDGLRPGVTMGCVHNRTGLDRAQALIADARSRGAKVIEGGRIDDEETFRQGHFLRPTLVSDISDDAPLVAEEQFCPVIPVLTYSDLDDAVTRANDTVFGLGGSVWGRDIDRAAQVAWRLQAGTVFVNTHGTENVNRSAPYGGIKQSGNGRRSGMEGLHEYTVTQTLTTIEN